MQALDCLLRLNLWHKGQLLSAQACHAQMLINFLRKASHDLSPDKWYLTFSVCLDISDGEERSNKPCDLEYDMFDK